MDKRLIIVGVSKATWQRIRAGYENLPHTPPDAKIVNHLEQAGWIFVKVSHPTFSPVPEAGLIPIFSDRPYVPPAIFR